MFDIVIWVRVSCWTIAGAVVGSFLNVVVYRAPLGINLMRPRSHCPACKRPIRGYDNVPVLSWLILRGRCRYCRSPISPRYPIVEAITALLFAVLAAVEYASSGANLVNLIVLTPPGRPGAVPIFAWDVRKWALFWVFLNHLVLLTTLLCAGLMEIDGNRLPVRLYLPTFLSGLATACMALLTNPNTQWGDWWHRWRLAVSWDPGELPGGAALVFAGLAVAAVCILWASDRLRRRAGPSSGGMDGTIDASASSWLLGGICVAVCLGWQVGAVILAAAAVLDVATVPIARRWPRLRIPASLVLLVATLGWILFAGKLVQVLEG